MARAGYPRLNTDDVRQALDCLADEIMALFEAARRPFHPSHLQPASARHIVQRMLANLVQAYDLQENLEHAEVVKQYAQVLA
ncbi:MAG: hypothetical protein ACR2JC_16015 [Chloroflexota bacterium]